LAYNLYGNPHSAYDPAELSGHAVGSIRDQALRFFSVDPEHFDLVFTASGNLKYMYLIVLKFSTSINASWNTVNMEGRP
jgi:hypothetical protein